MIVKVNQKTLDQLCSFGCKKEFLEGELNFGNVFNLIETEKETKKIGIVNFATSQLREDQLQPKINIYSLFLGSLFDNQKF